MGIELLYGVRLHMQGIGAQLGEAFEIGGRWSVLLRRLRLDACGRGAKSGEPLGALLSGSDLFLGSSDFSDNFGRQ